MPKHNEMHDIESLIVMVKNRPAIYDYLCTDHKNKEYTDCLWKEISDAVNMSPSLCKSKWLALRNSYSRELRNEKEAKLNPHGRRKRRKWYLAEDMEFLRNYSNYGQQKTDSINDEQIEVEADYTNFDDETCISSSPNAKPDTKYTAKEDIDVKLNSIPTESTETETPTAKNPIENPFKEYSLTKGNLHKEEIFEHQEQNMTFFRSILPDILKLSERRQRLFKQEVLSVLNRSLDEQEMGS